MCSQQAYNQRLKKLSTDFKETLALHNGQVVSLYPKRKGMEENSISPRQFQAIIKRLDEINNGVTAIKLKLLTDDNFIDSHDLMNLFHISPRTLSRWRKSGRLPYSMFNRKYYYKVDAILESFKVNSNTVIENEHPPP